jgi:hypothetical protein
VFTNETFRGEGVGGGDGEGDTELDFFSIFHPANRSVVGRVMTKHYFEHWIETMSLFDAAEQSDRGSML